jgi:hypothetical protein
MSISSRVRTLHLTALGFGAGLLIATTTGCPSVPCLNCSIKAAVFTVPPASGGATITDVVVQANGVFTDHCPGSRKKEGCEVAKDFASSSTESGKQQVTLTDWPFDSDDTVSATVKVVLGAGSGPAPDPVIIPASEVDFVVVGPAD